MNYLADTRKTILYADQHRGIRKITSEMLDKLGYRVIDCKNGSEVIHYYSNFKHEIDLIFLDLVMPTMDAAICIQKLKTLNCDLPIVVCSGYQSRRKVLRAIREGACCFIEKPYGLNKLAWAMHEGLKD